MYRIENTLSIPDRLLQTWLTVPSNIFDTLSAIPKDIKGVVKNTTEKIKNIFKSAVKKWKRYQRVWNTLLSPFVSLWAAVEWAVRTVVEPARNLFLNVRDSVGNFFKNIWNTIKRAFDTTTPVSDFSYEKLKLKEPTRKNRVSKLAWWKK